MESSTLERSVPAKAGRPPPKRKANFARVALVLGASLAGGAVLAAVTVFLVIAHYSSGLPDVDELKAGYDPPQLTRILARDGTVLQDVFTERRTLVSFAEIPDHAKLAFLAAEDAGFYEHKGLNYFGMLRALAANLRAGSTRQGGSTITQQVVKNVLLDPERTYRRKIRETILARKLEQSLTKDEILTLYLNHIYLGHGRHGIEEAARYYFGKKARALDLPESALLAGIVAAPERFSPRKNPEKALERRRYVLSQMLGKGFVTSELHEAVNNAALRLAPAADAESELSPEAVEAAKEMLKTVAGPSAGRGGYEVVTTIVPSLQAAARRAVRDNLEAYAQRHNLRPPYDSPKRKEWGQPFKGRPEAYKTYLGVVESTDDKLGTIDVRVGDVVGRVFLAQESRYNPGALSPSYFTKPGAVLRVSLGAPLEGNDKPQLRLELGPESALVALDVRTREVVALVGSYEALPGGRDRATQAKRAPGSSFKPFTYSYALHAREITPATVLELPPLKKGDPNRTISVRDALARSDNAAAIRIFRDAGPTNVIAWARALGIESHLEPNDNVALGGFEVKPIEIANAFAVFASGGEVASPVLVSRISRAGAALDLPARPPARRAMEEAEAYLVTSLMRSVVTSGTGKRALALGRPVAGKTGTTDHEVDTWFVGYSTDYVCAVWVGYDDRLQLGAGESGAATALPAWVSFMKAAHEGRPVTEFVRPNTIVTARIDHATGLLPRNEDTAIEEEFLDGTVPTQVAPPTMADAGAPAPAAVAPPVPLPPSETMPKPQPIDEPPPF